MLRSLPKPIFVRKRDTHDSTRIALAAALVAAIATPSLAQWQGQITDFDRERLFRLEESRAAGLAEADAGASSTDLAAIDGVLGPLPSPISAQDLAGTWRCRLMKLGGISSAIVYGWQTCRFRQTSDGLYFEKLTGTQRFSGFADPDGAGGFVPLAAMTVREEPQRHYSGAAPGAGAAATPNDAVGAITGIGPSHARIEFPYPVIESTFDVVELVR